MPIGCASRLASHSHDAFVSQFRVGGLHRSRNFGDLTQLRHTAIVALLACLQALCGVHVLEAGEEGVQHRFALRTNLMPEKKGSGNEQPATAYARWASAHQKERLAPEAIPAGKVVSSPCHSPGHCGGAIVARDVRGHALQLLPAIGSLEPPLRLLVLVGLLAEKLQQQRQQRR